MAEPKSDRHEEHDGHESGIIEDLRELAWLKPLCASWLNSLRHIATKNTMATKAGSLRIFVNSVAQTVVRFVAEPKAIATKNTMATKSGIH